MCIESIKHYRYTISEMQSFYLNSKEFYFFESPNFSSTSVKVDKAMTIC